jgi:hypothetical protein
MPHAVAEGRPEPSTSTGWSAVAEIFSHECVASFDELGEVVDSVGIGEAG